MNCWKCGRKLKLSDKLPGPGNVFACPPPCEAENYGPDEDNDDPE